MKVHFKYYIVNYRFIDEEISGPPHFAKAYFIEKTSELQRHAMTYHGFIELSRMLIDNGIKIGTEESFSVSLSIQTTMKQILNKNIISVFIISGISYWLIPYFIGDI